MSDAQYRCLVGYMMYWANTCQWVGATLDHAIRDVGITDSKEEVLQHLFKTGYDYNPETDRLSYRY